MSTAKEEPSAQHESKEGAKLISVGDDAERFRQMHNRALSLEVREDCSQKTLGGKLPLQANL